MKRTLSVLALLGFVLLIGAGYAEAALSDEYPTTLKYEFDNWPLPNGAIVSVKVGDLCYIYVYGDDWISHGDELTPRLVPVTGIPNFTTIFTPLARVSPDDPIGFITTNSTAAQMVTVQYVIGWYEDGATAPTHTNYPFQVTYNFKFNWVWIQPKSISLLDENGNKVGPFRMTAGETRTLYVEVDDYYNDGDIENDFNYFEPGLITNVTYTDPIEVADTIHVTCTVPPVSISDNGNLPIRLSVLTVTALNPGGTQQSTYDPRYATLRWGLTYTLSAGGTQGINTPSVSIRVDARDDAGDFEDGGGTCNAVGLGSLALVIPFVFLRKRK